MQVREAKDFLVQQTAEQAAMDGVALSDLEKQMMYFVENEEMPEDPLKLNEEFEAEYDSDEYEAKISKLMHHAYARLKKENLGAVRTWNEAIKTISKGDHYFPVLWGASSTTEFSSSPSERPPYDTLKLFGTAMLVAGILAGFFIAADFVADRYGIHWNWGRGNTPPGTQTSMPAWIQRLLIGSMVGGYVYYVLVPWITKKPPLGPGELLSRVVRFAIRERRS
jgi:hypothetical protein